MSFESWMNTVDGLVMAAVGMSVRVFPEQDFFDAYASGITPMQFFNEVMLPEMNDLGADADLLEDLVIHEDLCERYLRATGDSF